MPGFFHDRKEAGKSAGTRETVVLSGRKVSYELERKQVKNINLRIRPDGSIHVSASKHHTKKQIEALFAANEKMIFHSLERSEQLLPFHSSAGVQKESCVRQLSLPSAADTILFLKHAAKGKCLKSGIAG